MTKLERLKKHLRVEAAENGHTLARFVNYGCIAKSWCISCGEGVDTDLKNEGIRKQCISPGVAQYILVADTTEVIGIKVTAGTRIPYGRVMRIVRKEGGTQLFSYQLHPEPTTSIRIYDLTSEETP